MKKNIAIIRNYRGLKETNYIMNKEDFRKFINCKEEKQFDDILKQLNNGFEYYFSSDDNIMAKFINDEQMRDFINGEYNDKAINSLLRNYDKALSPRQNIEQYQDWYYHFDLENSSKDIVDEISKDKSLMNALNDIGGGLPSYLETLEILKEDFKGLKGYEAIERDYCNLKEINELEK